MRIDLRRGALLLIVFAIVTAPAAAFPTPHTSADTPDGRSTVAGPNPTVRALSFDQVNRSGVVLSSVDTPSVVTPGGTLSITATVENPTNETVTDTLTFTLVRAINTHGLSLADTSRQTTTLATGTFSFGAGSAGPIRASIPTGSLPPGSYTLVGEFGGDRAISRLTIGAPFVVDALSGPETATPGVPFHPVILLRNPNPFPAVQYVETRVDGRILRRRPLFLGPGESIPLRMTIEPSAVASNRVRYGVYTSGSSAATTVQLVDAPVADTGAAGSSNDTPSTTGDGNVTISSRPAPRVDVVGWEDGHWYDDELALNASDGFSDAEFEAFVARAKARTEYLREKEMSDDVTVEVLPTENVTQPGSESPASPQEAALRDLGTKSSFLLGEHGPPNASLVEIGRTTTGGVTLSGYDGITVQIGSSNPGARVVREDVLVHEFVHVIQQQQIGGIAELNNAGSRDLGLGYRAVSEGDAEFVEIRFRDRCLTDWSCVDVGPGRYPPEWNVSGPLDPSFSSRGHMVLSAAPYVAGTSFVARAYEAGGWSAVDALYSGDVAPLTAAQVLHPERYPDDLPMAVPIPGESSDDWQFFAYDRFGEATIFAMFWYQATTNHTTAVDPAAFFNPDGGPYDRYNFTSAPSDGWVNDRYMAFVSGTLGAPDARYGYVWTTVWADEQNATEFRRAYQSILEGHGATPTGNHTWVIPDGPYADAFAVWQDGANVTIVNAPTVADLANVDADVASVTASVNATTPTSSVRDPRQKS